MSVRVMTAVWGIDLPDSEKIVLLALADCANDEGHCWPSMATLSSKCSKSDRTVQAAIKELARKGHLTRNEVMGKGCNYTVHPRNNCTPEAGSPPKQVRPTPEEISGDPRSGFGQTVIEPSKNHQSQKTSSSSTRAKPAREISEDWWPEPCKPGSVCGDIIAAWPAGKLEREVNRFRDYHASKGNRFPNQQAAWRTWVQNSREFGARNGSNTRRTGGDRTLAALDSVLADLGRGADVRHGRSGDAEGSLFAAGGPH